MNNSQLTGWDYPRKIYLDSKLNSANGYPKQTPRRMMLEKGGQSKFSKKWNC